MPKDRRRQPAQAASIGLYPVAATILRVNTRVQRSTSILRRRTKLILLTVLLVAVGIWGICAELCG